MRVPARSTSFFMLMLLDLHRTELRKRHDSSSSSSTKLVDLAGWRIRFGPKMAYYNTATTIIIGGSAKKLGNNQVLSPSPGAGPRSCLMFYVAVFLLPPAPGLIGSSEMRCDVRRRW